MHVNILRHKFALYGTTDLHSYPIREVIALYLLELSNLESMKSAAFAVQKILYNLLSMHKV